MKKRVVLDLLSLTEEAAMWQKNAFAKLVGTGTTSGRLRVSPKHIRMKRDGGVIVVTRSCLMLAASEFIDGLLHNLRKVKGHSNIEVVWVWGGAGALAQ